MTKETLQTIKRNLIGALKEIEKLEQVKEHEAAIRLSGDEFTEKERQVILQRFVRITTI